MSDFSLNDLLYLHYAREDYKISDRATDTGDSDVQYIGYVNRKGEWYILKEDRSPATANVDREYRFWSGSSNYTAGWAGREGYSYERYDVHFA